MLHHHGRPSPSTNTQTDTVFQRLGGELAAVDPWTRVDGTWLDAESQRARDVVGYRGLCAAFRVAGLTLGDADAAPFCPPFMVEIRDDRLCAQGVLPAALHTARDASDEPGQLHRWAAGSLSKDLRVVQFEDGDIALEAVMHLSDASSASVLREFVTAFSWDVSALHAGIAGAGFESTEEWVRRAALSISRSTPTIPLREHPSPDWQAFESPADVFCSLQPSGGLAESDNVLYAVRRDSAALEAVATMPGHRSEWDYTRLTDVWLARDGASAFARTLLCTGFVHTRGTDWRPIECEAVTAVSPFGLHHGKVLVLDGAQTVGTAVRLGRITGRFSRLVSLGERAIGIVGDVLVSARLRPGAGTRRAVADTWMTRLDPPVPFEYVAEIDVDAWSHAPALAVLGDTALVMLDAHTGQERARFAVPGVRHAKWIGPGWLMVVEPVGEADDASACIRVLDVVSGRWTAPVVTPEITRLAVRGDEIHVGYANQSIAVWDRAEVCRGIGAFAFIEPSPGEHGTGAAEPALRPDTTGITKA
jgi:hypothetical protein